MTPRQSSFFFHFLIVLLVIVCAHTAIIKEPPPYRIVTDAAETILRGQNPYAPRANLDFFKYSPLAGLLMVPFAAMPDAAGTFLFLLLQCLLFLWAFVRWSRAAGYPIQGSAAVQWIAFGSVFLDATLSIQAGQWNVGIFALMLLGAAQYAEGKHASSGWVLSLGTVLKLFPFTLGLCLLTGLKKRFWGGFLAGLILWTLLPSVFIGVRDNLWLLSHWFRLMRWDVTRGIKMLDIGSFLSLHFEVTPFLEPVLAILVGALIGAGSFYLFRTREHELLHRFLLPVNGLYVLLFSYLSESPTSVLASAGIFLIGMEALTDQRHRRLYWTLWAISLVLIPVFYSDLATHAMGEWARALHLKTIGYVYVFAVLAHLFSKHKGRKGR